MFNEHEVTRRSLTPFLLESLKRIKSDPRTKAIPVVVLTSSREQNDVVRSYNYGVNSYIVKPVNFESFAKAGWQIPKPSASMVSEKSLYEH